VTRHPGIVPHQHDNGGAKHTGVEQFLSGALERFGDHVRKHGDNGGTKHASDDADIDPSPAACDAARCGHNDADD
jgi:hypothetical protein